MLTAPPPPAVTTTAPQLPPLSFAGFRAGMPVAEATKIITGAKGSLRCKPTTDTRMRECNGAMPFQGIGLPLEVLVSSIRDSAAVIVFSAMAQEETARDWVQALTADFGSPNHKMEPGKQESWEWVRRGTMLRVLMHKRGRYLETAVTLTYGPLLDGLGPTPTKKPGS